jgi:hypothetical protein
LLFYAGYLQGYTHWTRMWSLFHKEERMSTLKSVCRLIEILMMDVFTKHGWRFSNILCYWFCYFLSVREAWALGFALFRVWCDYCVEDRVYPTIENNVMIMVAYISRCRSLGTFSFAWWNKISLHPNMYWVMMHLLESCCLFLTMLLSLDSCCLSLQEIRSKSSASGRRSYHSGRQT